MDRIIQTARSLVGRHIQDGSLHVNTTSHWGYAERQVPCMNDPGSCAYLDAVYEAHDVGMIYVGVLWLTIVAVLASWGLFRHFSPRTKDSRARNAFAAGMRRYLLPDAARAVFGRTTRLQVLILAVICGYLAIWSFVGITYDTWITPVSDMPGLYNTRTSLGPWSDRVGVLAYALTPLSVMLASRESLLSVITGVPYQHLNFIHRWLGYVIVIQSCLHTIAWCVVEVRLYQPQPMEGREWIKQLYMIWGVVALILLLLLYVLSLPFVIRRTGYEFFRKSHYVLAIVYCFACIYHWQKLHCFLTPAIILWFIDRFVRLGRTWLIHRRSITETTGSFFYAAQAETTVFPNPVDGDVVRLDFRHPHKPWHIGQHFYLCFTEGSIWQSHPFTPLNAPMCVDGVTEHAYVFRAKSGETRKIAEVIKAKTAEPHTTPVVLTGPYGEALLESHRVDENILCVAGGTGITYVLPVLLSIARAGNTSDRKVELVWFVRHRSDMEWIRPELDELEAAAQGLNFRIRIFTTRDVDVSDSATTSSAEQKEETLSQEKDSEKSSPARANLVSIKPSALTQTAGATRHPEIRPIVENFVEATVKGPSTVIASGPGGLMSELRQVIAKLNNGGKVWRGEERFDVSLQCDDRLEY